MIIWFLGYQVMGSLVHDRCSYRESQSLLTSSPHDPYAIQGCGHCIHPKPQARGTSPYNNKQGLEFRVLGLRFRVSQGVI